MRPILLVLAAIVLVTPACDESSDRPLPELARNLPQGWAEADLAFKERVRNRFPVGTPQKDVVDALESQGFTIAPDGKRASFEQPNIVCRLTWRIFWATDEVQNIRRIDGVYGGICL